MPQFLYIRNKAATGDFSNQLIMKFRKGVKKSGHFKIFTVQTIKSIPTGGVAVPVHE